MTITMPTRDETAICLRLVHAAIESLPRNERRVIQQTVLQRKPLRAVAVSLGRSETEISMLLARALLQLHQRMIVGENELAGATPCVESQRGAWPVNHLPAHGDIDAYIAAAKYFQQRRQWSDAVRCYVHAAEAVDGATRRPDAMNALRLAGVTFLEMAEDGGIPPRHRPELLASAKSYLHQARAVAELIDDKKANCSILRELATAYRLEGNLSIAKTHALVGFHLARDYGDPAEIETCQALADSLKPSDTEQSVSDLESEVARDLALSRALIDSGHLGWAETLAKRALALCLGPRWIHQAETIEVLLQEINERTTRGDVESRMRQLVDHLSKQEQALEFERRVRYLRRDGEFVGTAIAEIHSGSVEFWLREAWDVRWERFVPCDEERSAIEAVLANGSSADDLRIDVDELRRRG